MIFATMTIRDMELGGNGGYVIEVFDIDKNGVRTPYVLPDGKPAYAEVDAPIAVQQNLNFAYAYLLEHWGLLLSAMPTSPLLAEVPRQTDREALSCVWWSPCVEAGSWDYHLFTDDSGALRISFA